VLDTHIWLWWVNNDNQNLKPEWMDRIQGPEDVGVSAISCFEVAWLERHNHIALPCPRQEWLEKALADSGISLLPISPEIASLAVELPEHHRDPQDHIIIATALAYKGTLISADGKFPLYSELAGRLFS
jgi:PIN domain nuclease of toxin-antitoxin system